MQAPETSWSSFLLAVCLGGSLGALLRWLQIASLGSSLSGLLVVNLLGSVVLAVCLLGVAQSNPLWRPFYATGLCGSYTTFSAASAETWSLGNAALGDAVAFGAGGLVLGVGAAYVGFLLTRTLSRNLLFAVLAAPGAVLVGLAFAVTPDPRPQPPWTGSAVGLVAAGGTLGAVGRAAVGTWVARWADGPFPWGTATANAVGCVGLGVLLASNPGGDTFLFVGTGLLGSLTTFSTLAFDTFSLLRRKLWLIGGLNALGSAVGGVLAVAFGSWLGSRFA